MASNLALVVSPSSSQSVIDAFLAGRSPQTLRAYRSDLESFAAFLGETDSIRAADQFFALSQAEANRVALGYRNDLIERKLQPASINRKLAALRSFVKLARLLGHISWNLEDIPGVKSEAYRDTRGPGLDAMRTIFQSLEGKEDLKSRRDYAILRLLFDLALRRSEVCQLSYPEDLDLSNNRIWVLGKGRTEKTPLTIPASTREALESYIVARGQEPGSFFLNVDRAGKGSGLTPTSLYRMLRKLGADLGLEVRPHGVRHTSITLACRLAQKQDIGLDEVRQFSRHKSVSVLQIYLDQDRNVQGALADLVSQTQSFIGGKNESQ